MEPAIQGAPKYSMPWMMAIEASKVWGVDLGRVGIRVFPSLSISYLSERSKILVEITTQCRASLHYKGIFA